MKTLAPVIVVGGGHAGVEAAHASARMGCDVLLVTLDADALVRLSCNPAIGGIGKSHLVREVDAMGGLMGLAADLAGIHFRVLNRRRGPAVRGPRVQLDCGSYPEAVRRMVDDDVRIEVVEGEASALVLHEGRVAGLELADGRTLPASALVVTTGTFLRGKLYRGEDETPGGRVGEAPCDRLSGSLSALGVRLGRFKTGTPPRLVARSIELEAFEEQPGDADPEPLSFAHLEGEFRPSLPQRLTHIAHTSPRVHEVVRAGLDRSPLYTGQIDAKGPRYCPSFEDKVVRFADKPSHMLHLEPMGLEHPWIYVNGLSTSLPRELQTELVHAIEGLENAEIARFGYAVAYDFVEPTQLSPALELRTCRGLFLAGQICGTTGYEEAAALGLVAGINAALSSAKRDAWVPQRLESYLGVLVDDLTTRGVLEPYRMFTSRAEARLALSADTADHRLTECAVRLGVVAEDQARRARQRWERLEAASRGLEGNARDGHPGPTSPADRLRRGEELRPGDPGWSSLEPLSARERDLVVARARYRGYLEREAKEIERLRRAERTRIPADLDYSALPGLSHEVRQRLAEVAPRSIGQASRIPGVTPAALALLAAAVTSGRRIAS